MDKNSGSAAFVNGIEHSYLTKLQVCEMLVITQRTLEGWMHRGHIPYYKVGRWVRFREDDIHEHLRKYRVERCKGFLPTRQSTKLNAAAARQLG